MDDLANLLPPNINAGGDSLQPTCSQSEVQTTRWESGSSRASIGDLGPAIEIAGVQEIATIAMIPMIRGFIMPSWIGLVEVPVTGW